MKRPSKKLIKDTIHSFKRDVGIDGRVNCTNENLQKIDNWMINSGYDPRGVEGQMKLKIIHTYVDFIYRNFSFSLIRFMDVYANMLLEELDSIYNDYINA